MTHKVHNDLAVRVSFEDGVLVLEASSEGKVVVDLTVDTESDLAVVTDERLGTGVCREGSGKEEGGTVSQGRGQKEPPVDRTWTWTNRHRR